MPEVGIQISPKGNIVRTGNTRSSMNLRHLMNDDSCFVPKQLVPTPQVGPTKGASLGYGLVCTDFIKFLGGQIRVHDDGTYYLSACR